MLTILMAGGLGNQLFQYAAVRRIADTLGEDVEIDTRFLQQFDGISKELWVDQLPIRASVKRYHARGLLGPHSIFHRVRRKLTEGIVRPIYRENGIGFDSAAQNIKKNTVISGYFQSYKYLIPHDESLRRELDPTALMSESDKRKIIMIQNRNVASIHVRRGDYLKIPGFGMSDFENYAKKAMTFIEDKTKCNKFIIFSDDIGWCKSSEVFRYKCEFYEGQLNKNPMIDLYMMSKCSHHIIANSSYSWWAAWLGDSPEKIIIAPRKWIHDIDSKKSGIIPPHWTTII